GADGADDRMLKSLGRDFTEEEVLAAARICREEGIAVMLDLLLGAPGETKESLVRTIEAMKGAAADRVGIALGVRVYPGTALARRLAGKEEGMIGGTGPFDPPYYLDPAVAPFAAELIDRLIADDRRFLFFDPARPERNYNYDANRVLEAAIRKGYRGAYWDILRRI
ncbi:MAG: hypothetical protein NTV79_06195, partial [Candidatus Aureabacteria bacterium]|nr:hypothetical protein [Candidatus Auribacterota bacterium]